MYCMLTFETIQNFRLGITKILEQCVVALLSSEKLMPEAVN